MPVLCGWVPVLGGYPDFPDIHSGYQLGCQNYIWWILQGVIFDLIFVFWISLMVVISGNYVGYKDADIQPRYQIQGWMSKLVVLSFSKS